MYINNNNNNNQINAKPVEVECLLKTLLYLNVFDKEHLNHCRSEKLYPCEKGRGNMYTVCQTF